MCIYIYIYIRMYIHITWVYVQSDEANVSHLKIKREFSPMNPMKLLRGNMHPVYYMPALAYVSVYVCIYIYIYIYMYTNLHTYVHKFALQIWTCTIRPAAKLNLPITSSIISRLVSLGGWLLCFWHFDLRPFLQGQHNIEICAWKVGVAEDDTWLCMCIHDVIWCCEMCCGVMQCCHVMYVHVYL